MRAFIFPGQGSQRVGMGTNLKEASASARATFDEVDDALSQNLSAIMADGPEAELTLTENAQPAIMAYSIAMVRALEQDFGVSLTDQAHCVAGHSLGEYSALCAAGALSLSDTARLLKIRGQAMQSAVPVGEGSMAALLGANIAKAQAVVEAAAEDEVCEIANDNDPTQVVISGHKGAIERAIAIVKEHGIKRGIQLPVSAPFHCSLMQPAAEQMEHALKAIPLSALKLPIYANVTAAKTSDPEVEHRQLVEQVTGRVRWRESVQAMRADGVAHFVEFGGKVLGPMVGRIDREAETTSLASIEDLEAFAKSI